MIEMLELIKIIRDKAKSDILYAQARVSVCEELIELVEESMVAPMPNPEEEKPSIEEEPVTIFENSLNMGV